MNFILQLFLSFFKYYTILFLKRIRKHPQRIFPIFFIGSSFRFLRNTNYRCLYRSLKENNARYNATIGEYLINTRSVIRLINLCEIEIDCCVNNRRYLNRKDKKLFLSHLQRGIIRFLKQAAFLLSVEFLYTRLYFANNYAFLPREKYIIVGWLAASRISNDRNKKNKFGSSFLSINIFWSKTCLDYFSRSSEIFGSSVEFRHERVTQHVHQSYSIKSAQLFKTHKDRGASVWDFASIFPAIEDASLKFAVRACVIERIHWFYRERFVLSSTSRGPFLSVTSKRAKNAFFQFDLPRFL